MDWTYAAATSAFRFRIAYFLRLGLVLCVMPTLRAEHHLIVKIMPKFFKTFVMVCLLIVLYAFFGVILFGNSTEEGAEYFPDIWESMWSLLILLTTANNPDVMMPAYSQTRAYGLFFASFLLVGLFFLQNLLLAQVFSSYQDEKQELLKQERRHRETLLVEAFHLLTGDQNVPEDERYLTPEIVRALIDKLNQTHKNVRHITREQAQLIFAILDQSGDEQVDLEEFGSFVDVLRLRFERTDRPSFVELWFPETYSSDWFQSLKNMVQDKKFEWFIDFCLVLNGALVVSQTFRELTGRADVEDAEVGNGKLDTWGEAGETLFAVIYTVEMILKLWTMGFRRYCHEYKNLFDGVVTLMGIVAVGVVYYPNSISNAKLIRYIVFARILRLVRLVTNMPQFVEIGETFVNILPAAKRLLGALFCIMFLFACVGLEFFGGKINTDPSSPYSTLLSGTDFATANYYANNFNDLASGMMTLFDLLIVNNWFILVDGFTAVTSEWYRFYFIWFYCIGVLITLNIVVAYILDNYQKHEEHVKSMGSAEQESHHFGKLGTIEDAAEVTGTQTSLKGGYEIRMDAGTYYQSGEEFRLRLGSTRLGSGRSSLEPEERTGTRRTGDEEDGGGDFLGRQLQSTQGRGENNQSMREIKEVLLQQGV